jgi:hypothetical protein
MAEIKLDTCPEHLVPTIEGIDRFDSIIKEKVNIIKANVDDGNLGPEFGKLILFYNNKFGGALKQLAGYIKDPNHPHPYETFYEEKDYLRYLNDLVYLGIWDDCFTNDPEGKRSPLGPLLLLVRKYKKGEGIGIIQAAEQQMKDTAKYLLLKKAQRLAIDIFKKFLGLNELPDNCHHIPIVQYLENTAATILSGLLCPSIILLDETKTEKLSNLSALPHECGHVVSRTQMGLKLLDAIKGEVEKIKIDGKVIPHKEKWKNWMDECLADAIAVATIREGEIKSLANKFVGEGRTNIIDKDIEDDDKEDVHPVKHIRVLLTIEIGRLLGIKGISRKLDMEPIPLKDMELQWEAFGRKKNAKKKKTDAGENRIENRHTGEKHNMENFRKAIKKVAIALVKTPYPEAGNKSLEDIFKDFHKNNQKAKEFTGSIKSDDETWFI